MILECDYEERLHNSNMHLHSHILSHKQEVGQFLHKESIFEVTTHKLMLALLSQNNKCFPEKTLASFQLLNLRWRHEHQSYRTFQIREGHKCIQAECFSTGGSILLVTPFHDLFILLSSL